MARAPLNVLHLSVVLALTGTSAPAQTTGAFGPPTSTASSTAPASTQQTKVLRLRFAAAAEAAAALAELHPNLTVRPEAASNTLVLSGARFEVAEAETLVSQLDAPRELSGAAVLDVELCLVEWSVTAAGDSAGNIDVDALLDGKGTLKGVTLRNDYRLRVVDQVPAMLQVGAVVAVAQGVNVNDPRIAAAARERLGGAVTFQRQNAGTLVRVTTRQLQSGQVLVDYQLELSGVGQSLDPQTPPPTHTLTSQSTVVATLGKGVVAGGFGTHAADADGSSATRTLILLRVRPVAP